MTAEILIDNVSETFGARSLGARARLSGPNLRLRHLLSRLSGVCAPVESVAFPVDSALRTSVQHDTKVAA